MRLCLSGVGGRGRRGGIREEKRVLPYFVVRPTVSFDRHASVRTLLRIPFFCKGILSRTQLWDHIYIFAQLERKSQSTEMMNLIYFAHCSVPGVTGSLRKREQV